MSIANEIEKLQALHAQGALTDDEFSQAKAALLARISDQPSASDSGGLSEEMEYLREQSDELSTETEYLRVQKELYRLDRNWERERENHKVNGPYNTRYIPRKEWIVIQAIAGIGFAIFVISGVSEASTRKSGSLLFLAIGLIVCVVFGSVYLFDRASAYTKAEQRYLERRSDLASRRASIRQNRAE